MSLETWDAVEQQPDGQKVSRDRGRHSRRMRAAAVRGAEAFQGMALPGDGQENRRNEKCMYLGRSQKITQPVQVRGHQENAMMFSPFGHLVAVNTQCCVLQWQEQEL